MFQIFLTVVKASSGLWVSRLYSISLFDKTTFIKCILQAKKKSPSQTWTSCVLFSKPANVSGGTFDNAKHSHWTNFCPFFFFFFFFFLFLLYYFVCHVHHPNQNTERRRNKMFFGKESQQQKMNLWSRKISSQSPSLAEKLPSSTQRRLLQEKRRSRHTHQTLFWSTPNLPICNALQKWMKCWEDICVQEWQELGTK